VLLVPNPVPDRVFVCHVFVEPIPLLIKLNVSLVPQENLLELAVPSVSIALRVIMLLIVVHSNAVNAERVHLLLKRVCRNANYVRKVIFHLNLQLQSALPVKVVNMLQKKECKLASSSSWNYDFWNRR